MESFILKNRNLQRCLTVEQNKKNESVGRNCSTASSSLNMRWIWVKRKGNVHLMNVMTLQCLEFLTKDVCTTTVTNYTGEVAMKQCKKTNGQFTVVTKGSTSIHSELCVGGRRYYLALRRRHPAYQAQSIRGINTRYWENEGNMLHRRNSTYKG